MKLRSLVSALTASLFAVASAIAAPAPSSLCDDKDACCKTFETLLEAGQPERVIAGYKPSDTYSDQALLLVGSAYLALASRDDIAPEQEETYYRKALEVKHYIAYMGLYFLYAQKDRERALGFLRAYVKTKPADTVPYVILGETELSSGNYAQAAAYLREAKNVAHAHSPRVDWMLFQASYMLQNYSVAAELFESAVTKGSFDKELKALLADPRFFDINKRSEFRAFRELLEAAKTSP